MSELKPYVTVAGRPLPSSRRQPSLESVLEAAEQQAILIRQALVDAQQRQALNECQGALGSVLAELEPALKCGLSGTGSGLPEAENEGGQRAVQLLWLLFELAQEIVHQREKALSWFSSSRPYLDAVSLALSCGWLLQQACVLTYQRVPPRYWQQCHALFSQITSRGWQDRRTGGSETVFSHYARILLLGLTASGSLEQVKLKALFALLEEDAGLLLLRALPVAMPEKGGFVFDSRQDEPPRFSEQLGGANFVLDFGALLLSLRSRLHQVSDPAVPLQMQLLLRLRYEWEGSGRRRHVRYPRMQNRRICVRGQFDACWDALNQDFFARPLRMPAIESGELSLALLDISMSGVLLRGEVAALHAGDVVLLGQLPHSVRCGMVRRVSREAQSKQARYGIEYLGKQASAVMVRVENSLNTQDQWQAAFSLRADARHGHGNMLLLEGRPFQMMRVFTLWDRTGWQRVQASHLRAQNTRYQLFEYKVIAVGLKAPVADAEA